LWIDEKYLEHIGSSNFFQEDFTVKEHDTKDSKTADLKTETSKR